MIEFGSDLGYLNWKDIGLNPYGNSLIVNGAFLEKNPKLVEDFVRISQKAFAACVADVAPCLKALLDQVSGLDKENQERQWERIKFLMTDEFTTTKALGWIDGERMKKDYELVQTYLGMEKPFDVETRVHDQAARHLDQDGREQGQEVRVRLVNSAVCHSDPHAEERGDAARLEPRGPASSFETARVLRMRLRLMVRPRWRASRITRPIARNE